ncbi:MAG: hypothetical protein J0H21_10825, partial [Rhizobiales bacterium]|nr:hypothetical protein [Hyphomicrobiales bacterium]
PYGRWIEDEDYGYVFVPKRRGAGWRPYQEGRWTWTDDYGWYWESSEPFGWATYHYGRWDYSPDYGWYWVPGDTWSPAWVTFRVGGGAVGWAPIAPDRSGYQYGAPRRYDPPVSESWVFVDDRYFDDDDIGRRAAPVRDIDRYLGEARDVRRPKFEDGRYYNEPVGRRDRPGREVVYVDDQSDIFDDDQGGRIGVFRPRIDDQRFDGRPDRFDRDVPRDDRTLIHQYVEPDPKAAVAGVVSAALLSVLSPDERRDLRRDRDQPQQRDRMQAEIDKLKAEKADLVAQQRQAADARAAEIDAATKKAAEQRQAEQERIRQERAARADEVLKKVEANPQPPEPQVPADGNPPPVDQGQPERPNRPDRGPDQKPAPDQAGQQPDGQPQGERPRKDRPGKPADVQPAPAEQPAAEQPGNKPDVRPAQPPQDEPAKP